jgi:hypothetical protein
MIGAHVKNIFSGEFPVAAQFEISDIDVILSLRRIWRGAHQNAARIMPMRAGSFGTEVPQDDAGWRVRVRTKLYERFG